MTPSPKSQLSMAALGLVLVVVLVQVYLFETVLSAVLDGQRGLLPGAFAVSAVLTGLVLWIALKLPSLDRKP
ncbi:MAG: hypothetical protein Q8O00_02975 [Holophaga sp.]|nr:hypothetical protein [Holophaga sp.]